MALGTPNDLTKGPGASLGHVEWWSVCVIGTGVDWTVG